MLVFVYPRYRGDMADGVMLGHAQILQYCSACRDATPEMVYTKSFETLHTEMLEQQASGGLFIEYPLV